MKIFIKIALVFLLFINYLSISFGQYGADLGLTGNYNICTSSTPVQKYKIIGTLDSFPLPIGYGQTVFQDFDWQVTNGIVTNVDVIYVSSTAYEVDAYIEWFELCGTGTIDVSYLLDYSQIPNGDVYRATYNHPRKEVRLTEEITIPPPVTVAGSRLIECKTTPIVEYEVTTPSCFNTYKWTFPSSWTVPSNLTTKKVSVTPDHTEGGSISIELSNTTDGGGCLNLFTETITVLRRCPPFEEYKMPTNSLPLHTATEDYILVEPSSGYIEVLPSQQIRFKAGKSIKLLPNFKAHSGSYFKAKIGNCENCNAYRPSNNNSSNIAQTTTTATDLTANPNPTTGIFDLYFQDKVNFNSEDMITIEIYSIDGQLVQRTLESRKNHYQLDISELPSSLYLVKLLEPSGNVYNAKVVKQ